MSREYIFLSTFERKMAFSTIYKQKVCKIARFFAVLYIPGSMGAYLTPLTPNATTPCLC
jgi:hypothetical protein